VPKDAAEIPTQTQVSGRRSRL